MIARTAISIACMIATALMVSTQSIAQTDRKARTGKVAQAGKATTVKVTPLGARAGEFCATDRAMLFEDPAGVRILYDAGRSVAGANDPRLGDVHVVLLSHAHGDHIGDEKAAGQDAGTCAKPDVVPASPNSNTAEIAAAKNSALVTGMDM